jgi:hypothetical protein
MRLASSRESIRSGRVKSRLEFQLSSCSNRGQAIRSLCQIPGRRRAMADTGYRHPQGRRAPPATTTSNSTRWCGCPTILDGRLRSALRPISRVVRLNSSEPVWTLSVPRPHRRKRTSFIIRCKQEAKRGFEGGIPVSAAVNALMACEFGFRFLAGFPGQARLCSGIGQCDWVPATNKFIQPSGSGENP